MSHRSAPRRRSRTVALATTVTLASTFVAVTQPAGASAPTTSATRTAIAGSVPAWAKPAAKVRDANSAQRMRVRVYLTPRDQAGMAATAQAIADPSSPQFRSYLTPAAVRARYAPTSDAVAQVQSWLRGAGFAVGYVPPNNQFVEATGTVGQAEAAFAVDIAEYQVRDHTLRAPDHDLSVPASLAGAVRGVFGVDQAQALMTPNHTTGTDPADTPAAASRPAPSGPSTSTSPTDVPPSDGFRNSPPCSAYWAEQQATVPAFQDYPTTLPYAPCGYKPRQVRQVYGTETWVGNGLDGGSATVAVIDAFASPTILQDATEYARRNDPTHPFLASRFNQLVFPVNPDLEGPDGCDAAGWYGEETLDIEAVHAMAPGARILYVGGSDCQDISLDKALNEVVSKNLAQIVSNSYGDLGEDIPADEVAAFQDIAIQGVLQGIGIYFSSGDSGDEVANLGFPSADFSASSPWVTAVGGTSIGIGQNGQRVFETGWETDKATLSFGYWLPPSGTYLYGSGGGSSRLFSQPFYQRGVVPNALAAKNHLWFQKGRVVPDISMVGDPNTGFLVGQTQTFPEGVKYDEYRIGGTSLSSPLFAGLMALADDASGTRHGFINPVLYQRLNGTAAIKDVTHVKGAEIRVDYKNGVDATNGTTTSIRTFDDQNLAIRTRVGYDDTTGLGIPNGLTFLLKV